VKKVKEKREKRPERKKNMGLRQESTEQEGGDTDTGGESRPVMPPRKKWGELTNKQNTVNEGGNLPIGSLKGKGPMRREESQREKNLTKRIGGGVRKLHKKGGGDSGD